MRLIKLTLISAIIAVVTAAVSLSVVHATGFSFHREWSNWGQWNDWGECRVEELDHQCGGTLEGTQSRSRTRLCVLKPGGGQNECAYVGQIDTQYQHRGCEIELPACEPEDQCENIEGLQEVVPEGYYQEKDEEGLVCFPEEQPTPTPTPTETPAPQPEQPKSEPAPAGAPVCTDGKPGGVANIFVDQGKPNDGKLEVRWLPEEPKGNKAHIRYSEVDGDWRYALLNTDNDGVESIGELQNGVHYWFQVAQVNGCAVGDYSRSFDPLP